MTAYKKFPGTFTFSSANQEISQRAKEEKERYKQFLQLVAAKRREHNRAYWKKRRLRASSSLDAIVKV